MVQHFDPLCVVGSEGEDGEGKPLRVLGLRGPGWRLRAKEAHQSGQEGADSKQRDLETLSQYLVAADTTSDVPSGSS